MKYVGPNIRLQSPWSSINNTFNFGLKPSISKILSCAERVRMFLISSKCIWTVLGYKVQGTQSTHLILNFLKLSLHLPYIRYCHAMNDKTLEYLM